MPQPAPNEFSPSPKQIIFLFMTATVVAVVVFLFGLLVGRGVPFDRAVSGQGLVSNGATSSYIDERPATILERQSAEPSAAVLTGDEFSYGARLQQNQPSEEDALLGMSDGEERLGVDAPRPMPDGEEDVVGSDDVGLVKEPGTGIPPYAIERYLGRKLVTDVGPDVTLVDRYFEGDGFTVQVMSLRDRTAAERVASGLIEKGYEAFVAPPVEDAPVPVFRVRVGRYSDRQEAERIKNRLEQNEQLKPWITH